MGTDELGLRAGDMTMSLAQYVPKPAGFKQQGSRGKGATTSNLGSGDAKEGDKTNILFKSHLLLENGGLRKLKPQTVFSQVNRPNW